MEAWLDSLDPRDLAGAGTDASHLRAIATASRHVANAMTEQAQAVEKARINGETWTSIAAMLGISRQAAKAKFGEPASL